MGGEGGGLRGGAMAGLGWPGVAWCLHGGTPALSWRLVSLVLVLSSLYGRGWCGAQVTPGSPVSLACTSTSMTVTLNTEEPFTGRLFAQQASNRRWDLTPVPPCSRC